MLQNVEVIKSPVNVSDKERYFSEVLANHTRQKITAVVKLKNGDIKITFEEEGKKRKKRYFVRVCKKSIFKTVEEYMKNYNKKIAKYGCKNFPHAIEILEYEEFYLIFFVVKKR